MQSKTNTSRQGRLLQHVIERIGNIHVSGGKTIYINSMGLSSIWNQFPCYSQSYSNQQGHCQGTQTSDVWLSGRYNHAQSIASHQLNEQLQIVTWLFPNIGFQINWEKSVTNPREQIFRVYGGFNGHEAIPSREDVRYLQAVSGLTKIRENHVQVVSKNHRKMTAIIKDILPVLMQYKHLQRLKVQVLYSNSQS